MKITLRKANALQNAIQDHIKTIDIKTDVSLNEFQSTEREITRAREALIENDRRRADLTVALYAIRAAVGNANSTSGVNDHLANAAYIDKRLGHLKGLCETHATEELTIIDGKLNKIRNEKERGYSYRDTVSVGVLTADQIAQYKADAVALKKQKQSLNDKILELNIRTEITLSDDIVAILQREQLV